MADFVFNRAKGRFIAFADAVENTTGDEALVLILLAADDLVDDDTMQDYETVAEILAGTSNELTGTGYSRRVLSGVSVSVDNTTNRAAVSVDEETYTITGSSPKAGKAIVAYDPDTESGDDSDLIPLLGLDCEVTFPDGIEVTLLAHSDGIGVARNPS